MSAKPSTLEETRLPKPLRPETAFGCPRDFLGNRFVYAVISPRAHGLSIGVNMNPDKLCNFNCIYCEIKRNTPSQEQSLDITAMAQELEKTLQLAYSGAIRELPAYGRLSEDLLKLRHVALSGDGEPTLCPNFVEAVQAVTHVRACQSPFFKIALITNGTGLDLPAVQEGLRYLTRDDEVWVKLDAGTQKYMDRVNRSEVPLQKVLDNALALGRKRSIIIQSLFPAIEGLEPEPLEIDEYILRLRELREAGANISEVQVYSATRPVHHHECGHLSLKCLVRICHRIRAEAGLRAELY